MDPSLDPAQLPAAAQSHISNINAVRAPHRLGLRTLLGEVVDRASVGFVISFLVLGRDCRCGSLVVPEVRTYGVGVLSVGGCAWGAGRMRLGVRGWAHEAGRGGLGA